MQLNLWIMVTGLVGAVLATASILVAQTMPTTVPAKGSSVLRVPAGSEAVELLQLNGSERALASVSLGEAGGGPHGRVVRISTRAAATQDWNVQLSAPVAAPVHAGDVVFIRFWARCQESMTSEGSLGLVFETTTADHSKAMEVGLSVGGEWTELFVPFRARRDFGADTAQICFRLGYDRQTIEIAGLSVVNYGTGVKLEDLPRTRLTYAGRELSSPWRAEAAARIEKYRKADLAVQVTDESGAAISGAAVEVSLKRHKFGFGTCVDAGYLMGSSPDSEKYRQIVETYFNRSVFENDMKWPALWAGFPEQTDKALEWLRERGHEVRGHNLLWPSWRWLPRDLKKYSSDPQELRRIIAEHITNTVTHYKGKLIQWDVVNEPYSEKDLLEVFGQGILEEWYALAVKADPNCRMYLNDYGIFDNHGGVNAHANAFFNTLKTLKDSGAPLHGIGIQSHFASDLPSPTALYACLERFSSLGLPIESTECSLNIDDRQLQADYLRDYVTVLFSHPNVDGVVLWGFWSKRHWRPQGALWDESWHLRPHGQMWIDLVTKVWTTHETAITTGTGQANVRGFLGFYDISIKINGRELKQSVELKSGGTTVKVVVPR